MIHSTVFNTSQLCAQFGVRYAVLSPGSRNAPLTISFARNENIIKKIVPDERAAAFIALGIAQETKTPVVLCCTSGTALLNYAPAIAEAYYREIPLLVLSADRPPELIDQRDGQTIRQFEALRNHVKKSIQLPTVANEIDAGDYERGMIDGLQESLESPQGPIHINIPFREPFYPDNKHVLTFSDVDIPHRQILRKSSPAINLRDATKILVVLGQMEPDERLQELTAQLSTKIPILRSPLNNLTHGIECVDGFISNQKELIPELLITSGLSVLSKNLKNFIRRNQPKYHLHFDEAGIFVDTYQSVPEVIPIDVKEVLKLLIDHAITDPGYLASWESHEKVARNAMDNFISSAPHSELTATQFILNSIGTDTTLHLSNSMPVRYADLFGTNAGVSVLSNRGTSGIDGCTSTAFGSALVSTQPHILITGDLAFFYDINAFFHPYSAPNFKVIIMNNQGGGIFRLIDGPATLPELESYFETRHKRTAKYICAEYNYVYHPIRSIQELVDTWDQFIMNDKQTCVMEIFTDPSQNQNVYKRLRLYLNDQINQLGKSS